MLLREFTGADIDADNERVRIHVCILKRLESLAELGW
jgi:hypothetical protein